METLYIEASSIECSEERREISGKIVPLGTGEIGHTNLGAYTFAANSIEIADPSKIKLLSQHDLKKPIGRMTAAKTRADGIYATFKLSRSSGGNDALIMAQEGLVTGLSIGAEILASKPSKDGHTVVSSAKLKEVSLVTVPAFASSEILEIAAEQVEGHPLAPVETNPTTESETPVVEDTTPVEATPSVEAAAVEAARPTVTASYYTTPRLNLNITAGEFAKAQLNASRGDADARELVAALQVATVSENTGMVPPTYLKDVIGIIDSSRPFIDSIERAALPASGMKIFTPKLGTQASVDLTAEGAEFASTDTTVTFQEDNVVKFAGAGTLDLELVDRSDPSFLDLYLRELAASYAQKTDQYAAKIAADGSSDSSSSTIYKAIAKSIADSFGVMRQTPNNLLVATSGGNDNVDFASLLGEVDNTGRPLYAAAAPMNANGLITQGSTNGTIAGLNLVVDPNYTGGTSNIKVGLVYPTMAMRFHESGTLQIRTNVVANGQLEIGIYGYVAVVNRYPAAFRAVQVA
jgi:HK97 family phage prohead protease